ncbi:MAG: Glutathione S-transferase, N-terminal [Ramlibacter sp.]|nr:Glutathione S-transferase, N-terminal [Ramlibacter sp.]
MLPDTTVGEGARGIVPSTERERSLIQRPLLFTYRRCPYAMRARMALLVAEIEFDAHEVTLRNKPSEMLRMSPKATVPVLVLPGGQVVDQSLEIMRWAFHRRDPGGWWERAQSGLCQDLVRLNDGPFKQHLDGYKYPERDPLHLQPEVHRDRAVACLLEQLEEVLSSQRFLGGGEPCAADLAIFPFVRQYRAVNVSWFDGQELHATRRWVGAWLDSEVFQRCMKTLTTGITQRF